MFFDSHVHSAVSPDSEMCPQAAISALKSQGLGVAFTEHVDFGDKNPRKDPNSTDAIRGIGDFVCDFAEYEKYRAFRGGGVALGLEFGLVAAYADFYAEMAAGDWDFIIGSLHSVDGVELYHAANGKFPHEEYARRLTSGDPADVRGCVSRYLAYSREMVEKCSFFDSFGHIDYIARYLASVEAIYSYENFCEEFDALLKAIAEREIALEINTSRFGCGRFEEINLGICRRFFELGGKLATIGSDGHDVSSVGRGVASAREIADAACLAVVHYRERKPLRCG